MCGSFMFREGDNWWEWSSHSSKQHAHDHPPETAQMIVAKFVEKFDSGGYTLTLLHLD